MASGAGPGDPHPENDLRVVLLAIRNYYTDRTYAYVIPQERALDVDTPWDLRMLEALLRAEGRG